MVFDKHRNGIPIAWVISWMLSLFAIGIKERPNWHAQAFIIDDAAVEIGALRWHVKFFQRDMKQ